MIKKKAQVSLYIQSIFYAILIISAVVGLLNFIDNDYNNFNYEYSNNSRLYPNSLYTPGDILTTNKSIICVTGYSSTVRDVPTSLKKKIYYIYNLSYPQPTGMYELEHFIALSLGGSNDEKNLWIMPNPEHNWKTRVDRHLLKKVCDENELTVEEAQQIIINDWYEYYLILNNSEKT